MTHFREKGTHPGLTFRFEPYLSKFKTFIDVIEKLRNYISCHAGVTLMNQSNSFQLNDLKLTWIFFISRGA